MDSENDYRRIDYENTYRGIFGCDEGDECWEDVDGNPLDDDEIAEIKRERVHIVRRKLGWE